MRIFLGIFVFLVWASICRYGYVCEIKKHCISEPIEEPRAKTLDLILDDSITYLKDYDQFVFKNGLIDPELNDNNKLFLDSLASVMKNDSTVFLTITGLFRPSEKDQPAGIFEDLGLARADVIRKLLINRGIAEDRISLDSRQDVDEELSEPLEFLLYTDNNEVPDEFSKVQFSFTNMTYSDANFEKDSPVFDPGEALKLYADSVKTYFELNPDKTFTIIGHCDSDGTDEYNMELGIERAESAKAYFANLGITVPIKIESKGESDPIAPNNNEENMQKNRRVNFVIE